MNATRLHGRVPRSLRAEHFSEPGVAAREDVHAAAGRDGDWSRKYHYRHFPTRQIRDPHRLPLDLRPQHLPPLPLQPWHFRTGRMKAHGDVVSGRVPILFGDSTFAYGARFERSCPADRFFRNGDGHELWFVQEGRGLLASEFGVLAFSPGHFVVVPKGTTYRVELESEECSLLFVESRFPIGRRAAAKIIDTEIDAPEFRPPRDEEGEFRVWTKHAGGFVTEMFLGHHPFDLIGWHGSLYPYAVHVHDVLSSTDAGAPIQLFESASPPRRLSVSVVSGSDGVARHDVDADRALFYSQARVASRKGSVERGSLTFHSGALPHCPQGAALPRSHEERGNIAHDLIVALDVGFEPLSVAKQAVGLAEKDCATAEFRDAHRLPQVER